MKKMSRIHEIYLPTPLNVNRSVTLHSSMKLSASR